MTVRINDTAPDFEAATTHGTIHFHEWLGSSWGVLIETHLHADVGHVPGSLHIGLTGQYESWAARILGLDAPLIIVGKDPESVRESQMRLARVGMESIAGYLEDGIAGWASGGFEFASIPQVTVRDFADLLHQEPDRIAVLDVREAAEVDSGTIENAIHIPLGKLKSRTVELDAAKLVVVLCRSG